LEYLPTAEKNPQALRRALAVQFKAFIDSDKEDAADIVAMTYQQLLVEPEQEPSSFHHISSLYKDDTVYIKPDHKRSYSGFMYEKLTITWKFSNLGTQTWRGRKLYLSNHDEIRPRAESNYIEIPETPPKTGVEISTVIELRPFEGHTTCHWIMVDSDDNDCYPGSRMFDIDIDVSSKGRTLKDGGNKVGEQQQVEKWVPLKDVQSYLGVGRETILQWIAKRNMPAYKVGRLWKFKLSEVDDWIRSGGASDDNPPEKEEQDAE
jgi:excisionase family DNA binding protein